jgi:hypothetical protein
MLVHRRRPLALLIVAGQMLFLASMAMPAAARPEDRGATTFTCTQVLGFSQTRNWFRAFQADLGDSRYQLLQSTNGGLKWQDPNFAGWDYPLISPCSQNSRDPDRIIDNISWRRDVTDVSFYVREIRDEVATLRDLFPEADIVLQAVIGGPNDSTCSGVHTAIVHPAVETAIAQVVAADPGLLAPVGPEAPEVARCSYFRDDIGHLIDQQKDPMGRFIASFYR